VNALTHLLELFLEAPILLRGELGGGRSAPAVVGVGRGGRAAATVGRAAARTPGRGRLPVGGNQRGRGGLRRQIDFVEVALRDSSHSRSRRSQEAGRESKETRRRPVCVSRRAFCHSAQVGQRRGQVLPPEGLQAGQAQRQTGWRSGVRPAGVLGGSQGSQASGQVSLEVADAAAGGDGRRGRRGHRTVVVLQLLPVHQGHFFSPGPQLLLDFFPLFAFLGKFSSSCYSIKLDSYLSPELFQRLRIGVCVRHGR